MYKRCVIITTYLRGELGEVYSPAKGDFILCADGGYLHAKRHGITPHKVVGDLDSLDGGEVPPELLLRAPKEKDDTDTMLCLRLALEAGVEECLIAGGIGGRLDHTIANIQTLAFAHRHGLRAVLADACERVFLMENEERLVGRQAGTISLFSYTERCEGVCISGVHYPLKDATLTHAFPLGVSNAFEQAHARISVQKGILLVILSCTDR